MATFEITRRIHAPAAQVYHSAHHQSTAWDPFGQRIHCMEAEENISPGNRLKILAWNGLSMVVEVVQVQAPTRSAMRMIHGPRLLERFAGTWLFLDQADGSTQARWRYHLHTTPGYRWLEAATLYYFRWESQRRLRALARYCEQQGAPA